MELVDQLRTMFIGCSSSENIALNPIQSCSLILDCRNQNAWMQVFSQIGPKNLQPLDLNDEKLSFNEDQSRTRVLI